MSNNKILYPFLAGMAFFAIFIALISFEGEEWNSTEMEIISWCSLAAACAFMIVTHYRGTKFYPLK